jgi:hypothetical protein
MSAIAPRPPYASKFRSAAVTPLIAHTLQQNLTDVRYDPTDDGTLADTIANRVRDAVRDELQLPRYRIIVQALVAENKGEGLHFAARKWWDAECDAMAESIFRNDSLFCSCVVFGVYLN